MSLAADLQIVRGSLASMTHKASQAINVALLGRYDQRCVLITRWRSPSPMIFIVTGIKPDYGPPQVD